MSKSNLYQFKLLVVLAVALLVTGCSSTDSGENEEENGSSAFFNSSAIAPGETFSYTFSDEESVDYFCEIHAPNMQGEVVVDSGVEAVERDTVYMEDNQFQPSSLSVAPDTEVIWINNDVHDHDIRTGNPSSNNDDGGY